MGSGQGKVVPSGSNSADNMPFTERVKHDECYGKQTLKKEIKSFYRTKHDQFKEYVNMLDSKNAWRPTDALGYELDVPPYDFSSPHTGNKVEWDQFGERLKRFCWLLRTFDEIDGSFSHDHVPQEQLDSPDVNLAVNKIKDKRRGSSMYSAFQNVAADSPAATKELDDEWPLSDEEMIRHFNLAGSKAFLMDKNESQFNWHKLGDLTPRELQAEWHQILMVVLDTWPHPLQARQADKWSTQWASQEKLFPDYVRSVRDWARDYLIPGGQLPHGLAPITQVPRRLDENMRCHLAFLCKLFNHGPLAKLAVLAEQIEMVHQMLRLYDSFKLISAVLHEPGSEARLSLLLGIEDSTIASLERAEVELMTQSPRRQGCHMEFTPGPERRLPNCVNCKEEDLFERLGQHGSMSNTTPCQGCIGPRCTDRIEFHHNFVDWKQEEMAKRPDLKYNSKAWGWEWPNHPIHSRWKDGRNALACATQTGNEAMVDLLLVEHSDVLATTFGGDTVVHVAARFEQEMCLYNLLCHALKRTPICKIRADQLYGAQPVVDTRAIWYAPLDDIRSELVSCELDLKQETALHAEDHGLGDRELQGREHGNKNMTVNRCPCRSAYFLSPLNADFGSTSGDGVGSGLQSTFRPYKDCCGAVLKEHQITAKPRNGLDTDLLNTTAASETELASLLEKFDAELRQASAREQTDILKRTSVLKALEVFLHMRNEVGRTPLHAAAAMDRDQITKGLIALGCDPADRDRFGYSCLQMMVENIPSVAVIALDQYLIIDRPSRRKKFYLAPLENTDGTMAIPELQDDAPLTEPLARNIQPMNTNNEDDYKYPLPRSMLEEVIRHERLSITTHPVLRRLVKMKWDTFVWKYHVWSMICYSVFLGLWLAVAMLGPIHGTGTNSSTPFGAPPSDNRSDYTTNRVVVTTLAMLFAAYYIYNEVADRIYEKKVHRFHARMSSEIIRNKQFGAAYVSSWNAPDFEKSILQAKELEKAEFLKDRSNIIDLIALTCLPLSEIIQIATALTVHQASAGEEPHAGSTVSAVFLSFGLIAAFFNLLKFARAFSFWGTFMATLSRMLWDFIKFGGLFLTIWLPFTVIFMVFFQNSGVEDAEQYNEFGWAFFETFRLTMVDGTAPVQTVEGAVLYFCWLTLSAIVFLNLFIAMMSASFQDIYDRAKQVAAFERASVVLSCEVDLAGGGDTGFFYEMIFPWAGALDKLAIDWLEAGTGVTADYSEEVFNDDDNEEIDSIGSMRTKLFLITSQIRDTSEQIQGEVRQMQHDVEDLKGAVGTEALSRGASANPTSPQHRWSRLAPD